MTYTIVEDAEAYFLNQIKLEKKRLGYFIPGCLFSLLMFWARTSSHTHRPWYIFILSSLYLLYGLVVMPIIQALQLRRVIRNITIIDNNVTFECFDFLFFNSPLVDVSLNDYQVSQMTAEDKKGRLLKYSPVLKIKIENSNQTFFYLSPCFENAPQLAKVFNNGLINTI